MCFHDFYRYLFPDLLFSWKMKKSTEMFFFPNVSLFFRMFLLRNSFFPKFPFSAEFCIFSCTFFFVWLLFHNIVKNNSCSFIHLFSPSCVFVKCRKHGDGLSQNIKKKEFHFFFFLKKSTFYYLTFRNKYFVSATFFLRIQTSVFFHVHFFVSYIFLDYLFYDDHFLVSFLSLQRP